ncbi:hypothetical protein U9M48_041136 [Paspalum notatum var. saurae]|uniref:Uncharacterized protein n=1 Tax=Paspalum notatum var. saurae TaxID=547442 RepID=A0AAQ3UMJ7_PASNO
MWISRSHPLLLGHSFLGQIMHPCFGRRRRGALMWTLDGAQRRETLLWINVLNNDSIPLSRPIIDHLLEFGTSIFFDKRCDEDSRTEAATSLASDNILTTLHGSLADFLELLLCLLGYADVGLDLGFGRQERAEERLLQCLRGISNCSGAYDQRVMSQSEEANSSAPSTPLSRSTMSNSNPCNCSSSHTTLLLWNVLETRDHLLELGTTICFVKRCDDASSMEMTISLASDNSLMTLQFSCSAAMGFLLIFLNCFCTFFTNRM